MLPRILRSVSRLATAKPALALAVLALAGVAAAAIAFVYTNASTLGTSVIPPPVQFQAGTDAGPSTLTAAVSAYSISGNKTSFSATVNGIPEGSLVVDSFAKIANVDSSSHSVTLSTPQVSNAYVTAYTIQILDASDVSQGTMTLTAASPSVTFTLPAGQTFHAKLTLTLATGAGADNVALSNAVTMTLA